MGGHLSGPTGYPMGSSAAYPTLKGCGPHPGPYRVLRVLFGLAPGGGRQSRPQGQPGASHPLTPHYCGAGGLLPHPFTLASMTSAKGGPDRRSCFCGPAVWGVPPPRVLPGTLPFGARTFLPRRGGGDHRPPVGVIIKRSDPQRHPEAVPLHVRTGTGALLLTIPRIA